MAEPSDLREKLLDAREIILDLIHDLSGNPVSAQEARCLRIAGDTYALIFSAGEKAEKLEGQRPKQ